MFHFVTKESCIYAGSGVSQTSKGICSRKEGKAMLTIEGLIAVISLALTAFALGYAIGCDDRRTHRNGRPGLTN